MVWRAVLVVLLWKLLLFAADKQEQRAVDYARVSYLDKLGELGVQRPEVAVAQIVLETHEFQSKIYKENHNLFGMKDNSRDWALGERYGHAYYNNDAESLADYIEWQKQMAGNRVFKTNDEYIYFLGHLPGGYRYATDPDYEKKLNHIIKKLYEY